MAARFVTSSMTSLRVRRKKDDDENLAEVRPANSPCFSDAARSSLRRHDFLQNQLFRVQQISAEQQRSLHGAPQREVRPVLLHGERRIAHLARHATRGTLAAQRIDCSHQNSRVQSRRATKPTSSMSGSLKPPGPAYAALSLFDSARAIMVSQAVVISAE